MTVSTEVIAQFVAGATAQAVAKAAPQATVVGKVSPIAYVALSAFHRAVFELAFKEQERIHRAEETMLEKMVKLIQAQYGSTMPTFKQFKADREALRVLALERGLVDDQWVRKPYNAAIHRLYGKLPVSDSEAAVAKRASREAAAKVAADNKAKAGAPKGETTGRDESADILAEQFIAKYGIARVLKAAAHILATRKDGIGDAAALKVVAQRYA